MLPYFTEVYGNAASRQLRLRSGGGNSGGNRPREQVA